MSDIRDALEEMCIGYKPGSVKGRQTSARFYIPELERYINRQLHRTRIDQMTEDLGIDRDSIKVNLEEMKRKKGESL